MKQRFDLARIGHHSVAGVRYWRPAVTSQQVVVFLIRSLCPCRRS